MSVVSHLSEVPWSNYTAADYSIQQWHNACLIHQHDGPPTSKNQCKLPVKTPNGALNRNGVHAAAAALAGARGGVHASAEEKASAAKALIRYYAQLGETAPASLLAHSNLDILEHFGVKGMHWGVRKQRNRVKRGTQRTVFQKSPKVLTDAELERRIKRMESEKKYNSLNKRDIRKGEQLTSEILQNSGKKIATAVVTGIGFLAVKKAIEKKFGKGVTEHVKLHKK